MKQRSDQEEELLTSGEVAAMFGVDRKTVNRWAEEGKIGSIKTLGGHRRFLRSEIEELVHSKLPEQRSGE